MTGKRAQLGEQIMIFVFIFMLVMIGGGIIIGTAVFVGPEFDFRETEATLLNYRLKQCLTEDKLTGIETIAEDLKTGFLIRRCGLNETSIAVYNLMKICKGDMAFKDCIDKDVKNSFYSTGGDFQQCDFTEGSKFVGCSAQFVAKEGENYVIITVSKQKIRRASA